MANIDAELQAISDAIYGEEVRTAIHDGIQAVNSSAEGSALVCENKATEASGKALLAESYAKGGTGIRGGEDTDNAKYYYEMARGFSPQGYDTLVEDVADMKVNKQNKLVAGNNITIDATTNTISAGGASTWSEVANKPFSTLGDDFTVEANVLKSALTAKNIMTDENMSIQKKLDELSSFESITYKGTVATTSDLPSNAENGHMYYCQADQKHYVCVKDTEINLYEWHEYHTFDDNYLITVEKVKNDLTTSDAGYVLDARQGKVLKTDLNKKESTIKSYSTLADAQADLANIGDGEYITTNEYSDLAKKISVDVQNIEFGMSESDCQIVFTIDNTTKFALIFYDTNVIRYAVSTNGGASWRTVWDK